MIEVDVFWSYAFGASFAAAAGSALKGEETFHSNKYFAYCVLFLSIIFSPSGIYLLWAFPEWESMFLLPTDKSLIDAILPTVFASSNVALGVFGFFNAWRCIRAGRELAAHTHWIVAYGCFAVILGFGYARFLYNGTSTEYRANVDKPMLDWFGGPVFRTLLVMGVVLLPAYFAPVVQWLQASLRTKARWDETQSHVVTVVVRFFLVVTIAFVVGVPLCDLLCGGHIRAHLTHGPVGWFAPLIGFAVAYALVFGITLGVPFFLAAPRGSARSSAAATATGAKTVRGRSRSPARSRTVSD